jgi:hypothetical protein
VYPFPSFLKQGILCSVVGHVERERERERERFRVSGQVRIERERDLGFQENCGESEREKRDF